MMKTIGQALMAVLASFLAMPHRVGFAVMSGALGGDRALQLCGEGVARVPGLRGVWIRAAFYRGLLRGFGRRVCVGYGSTFSKVGTTVADEVYIGRYCGVGLADLGEGCMLSDGVQVLSGGRQHGGDGLARDDESMQYQRVRIGRRAWIGANAVVMADVGDGAVVGAGAVVVKPIAEGAKAVGVPAKPLGPGLTIDWTKGAVAEDADDGERRTLAA